MKSATVTPIKQYITRLERGENVFVTLTHFCELEKVTAGVFSAIGAVKNTKIGYYDLATKQYGSKEYAADHEVASMTGNVVLVNGKPFLHIHAVLSGVEPGHENECVGGHVFAATVAVTLEVHMTVFSEPITRTLDEEIGLKLLDCGGAL